MNFLEAVVVGRRVARHRSGLRRRVIDGVFRGNARAARPERGASPGRDQPVADAVVAERLIVGRGRRIDRGETVQRFQRVGC